jgi:hypothetical protein
MNGVASMSYWRPWKRSITSTTSKLQGPQSRQGVSVILALYSGLRPEVVGGIDYRHCQEPPPERTGSGEQGCASISLSVVEHTISAV